MIIAIEVKILTIIRKIMIITMIINVLTKSVTVLIIDNDKEDNAIIIIWS